jgi:hypothetical protein
MVHRCECGAAGCAGWLGGAAGGTGAPWGLGGADSDDQGDEELYVRDDHGGRFKLQQLGSDLPVRPALALRTLHLGWHLCQCTMHGLAQLQLSSVSAVLGKTRRKPVRREVF